MQTDQDLLCITKACLYNFAPPPPPPPPPLKPHFYTVKLGFTGVYIIFLIMAPSLRAGRYIVFLLGICLSVCHTCVRSYNLKTFQAIFTKLHININKQRARMVSLAFILYELFPLELFPSQIHVHSIFENCSS